MLQSLRYLLGRLDEPLIITSTTDEWTASADKKTFTLVVTSNRTVTVEYTDNILVSQIRI